MSETTAKCEERRRFERLFSAYLCSPVVAVPSDEREEPFFRFLAEKSLALDGFLEFLADGPFVF